MGRLRARRVEREGVNAMNRRRFLTGMAGILAAGCAPAVLPSGIIMPVRKLWVLGVDMAIGPDATLIAQYDGLLSYVTIFKRWDTEFFYNVGDPKPSPLAYLRPDHEPR